MMIPAVRIGDHDMTVVFDLHAFVLDPQRADQLDAAHLEPHQAIRVINHTHLIRLRVAHAHHRGVIFNHSHVPYFSESPCQTGLRFSRNDASPSWKSGVQRMRAFSRMARSKSWSTPAAAEETRRCLERVRLLGLAAISTFASS